MKKGILMCVTFCLLVVVACKKDRACTCHTSVTSGYGNAEGNSDTVFSEISKKDAETRCEALEENVSTWAGSWTTTCELK